MRVAYHLLTNPQAATNIQHWSNRCQAAGFNLDFAKNLLTHGFSSFQMILPLFLIITATSSNGENICAPRITFPTAENQVYYGLPYAAGERAEYRVSYMGVLAGNAYLAVHPPILKDEIWYRSYEADARTGNWYKMLFVGHDSILAYSHPGSGIAAHFILNQDEGRLLGERTNKRTEIKFNHEQCVAFEQIEEQGKDSQNKQIEINAGVMDSLSAAFKLRTLNYQIGKSQRLSVYSSGKSWWLRIDALNQEKIAVPAGVFSTVKLALYTYLGDALQQKGEIFVWIATDHVEHPLVKIKAEVKIGALLLELNKFQAGNK